MQKKWILFLPEDEYHEIGLLMAQYFLRLRAEKVYYPGANVMLKRTYPTWERIVSGRIFIFREMKI